MFGNRALYGLTLIWCAVAVGGLCLLARAGTVSEVNYWPADTSIRRPTDHYFLLVFFHPNCPCSQSTLEELNRLLARCDGRVSTTIVFVTQTRDGDDWKNTALWNQAAKILNVDLICDAGGREAARFGATTSGQVFLFDSSGQMQFRGGITASRGHAGDNDGEEGIANIVAGNAPAIRLTPVYGCRLIGSMLPSKGQTCTY